MRTPPPRTLWNFSLTRNDKLPTYPILGYLTIAEAITERDRLRHMKDKEGRAVFTTVHIDKEDV